ncbi:putative minor capsid protein [Eel River basin pequenovirus]|nr:putative minor capsid protein [Eel River basin pequenovirus]
MGIFSALTAAAPLITAGAQLLGGVASAKGASEQLSQSEQLRQQFGYNTSAYRQSLLKGPSWEMEGLRRAGLNPILRYGSGGSSAPNLTGAVGGSVPVNRLAPIGDAISNSATSALDAAKLVADTEKTRADTRKATAEITKVMEEITAIQHNYSLTQAQRETEMQRQRNVFADTVLKWAQENLAREDAERVKAQTSLLHSQEAINEYRKILEQNKAESSEIVFGLFVDWLRITKRGAEIIPMLWEGATGALGY